MKTASPALIAHLATARMMRCADLYAITLSSGTTHRFTSLDLDLTADGYIECLQKAVAKRFGVNRRFIQVRMERYGLLKPGAKIF